MLEHLNLHPFLLSIILSVSCSNLFAQNQTNSQTNYAIVIHGGAGTILKKNMSDQMEKRYMMALDSALYIGEQILINGGNSIDAVEKTIRFMENNVLFNAGKGAVFTNDEKNELDASIMFGKDQNAGAVGGVTNIKHPISAARAVMEQSNHVMMVRNGAEQFSKEQGLEMVDPSYFHTERRLQSLHKVKTKEDAKGNIIGLSNDYKFGTVGCVALDLDGNICAGTSTGGMTNKKYNRIGDSPIIGAGTYADNATCGISSTGHGEYFIRYAVAHDIAARMEYKQISLDSAAHEVIMEKLVDKGGSGGIIGLDKSGNITMTFNTEGMYRAYAKPEERTILIYK